MNFIWDNIFKRNQREDAIQHAIKENILFKDLSGRELRLVQEIISVRHYRAGEPIFREGEIGVGMYILVSGRVEIYMTEANHRSENGHDSGRDVGRDSGREIYITQLLPGDFFGELSLVEEISRRTASAIAREETLLVGFFKPDLQEILRRSPNTGTKILSRLAEVLGRRLKETTDKVSDLRKAIKALHKPPPPDRDDETKAPRPASS
jgi:CRP/FNR family transcriptional regulator, cyclic AMP receptor protein